MLARAKFWICVNAYALLLDFLGLTAFVSAWMLFRTWFVAGLLLSIVGAYVLYGGIGIHSTYGEKCRIYALLAKRNAHGLRMETFKDFMSVPCHRLVVRMVLRRIDRPREYGTIKRRFYVPPWRRQFSDDTKLMVFKTKEEGDLWLSRQNNRNT